MLLTSVTSKPSSLLSSDIVKAEDVDGQDFRCQPLIINFFDICAFHESKKQLIWLVAKVTFCIATAKLAVYYVKMVQIMAKNRIRNNFPIVCL